jgi:hypothetical protein
LRHSARCKLDRQHALYPEAVPKKRDEEIVGNEAAAAHVGVKSSTWRAYVRRDQAPAPHRREIKGGHAQPVWWASALDTWQSSRRGQAWRRGETSTDQPR